MIRAVRSRSVFAGLALLAWLPAAARAQRAQFGDVVYLPGRWEAGRLVRVATTNPATDTLALMMRVDYFSAPPRWRAEIRRTTNGQNMGEPEVLIGDGARVVVVTALGSTPFEQHALSRDSLVRAVLVFDAAGRRQGPAGGRIVDRAAGGMVLRVAFRRAQRTASFDDALLNPGGQTAGRQLLASRIAAVGDQRSASVVATAGARGVDRVRTPQGEVALRPDSLAVRRMESFAVGAVVLEDFLRAGAIGPYAMRPAEGAPRP